MKTSSSSCQSLVFVLALVIVVAAAAPVSACLWYYGTNLEGEPVRLIAFPPDAYVNYLTDHSKHHRGMWSLEKNQTEINNLEIGEPVVRSAADFKERSDQAVNLVRQGKVKAAIAIFEEIERSHPGEYIIAANLGTAYELNGENERALKLISEGIRLNPDSHYGTEWLHVKILEAKLALAKDPDWLKTHSVLGLDFGSNPMPVMPTTWPQGQDEKTTLRALEYQLHERLAFVSPPDAIVGQLISDLGSLAALTKSLEHGVAIYDLALTFKPIDAERIVQRRDAMQQIVGRKRFIEAAERYTKIGILGLALGVIVVRVKRRLEA